MRQRTRKLIGAALLITLVPLYCLLVVGIAGQVLVGTSLAAQTAFFVVAGAIWVVPAGALISWMVRPDDRR